VKETLGSSISIGGKSDNIRIDKYNSEVIHINISFIFIIKFLASEEQELYRT